MKIPFKSDSSTKITILLTDGQLEQVKEYLQVEEQIKKNKNYIKKMIWKNYKR